jgi:transposase
MCLDSASPSEVRLLQRAIDNIAVPRKGPGRPRKNPRRIIADKGYDSDALRNRLARRGIDLICPYRKNKRRWPRYDGRKMRRYKRRWTVERTIGWFQNFRRLTTRYDRSLTIYSAFFHMACLIIALRQL